MRAHYTEYTEEEKYLPTAENQKAIGEKDKNEIDKKMWGLKWQNIREMGFPDGGETLGARSRRLGPAIAPNGRLSS